MRLPPLLRKLKTPPLSRRGSIVTPGTQMARDSSCRFSLFRECGLLSSPLFTGARPPAGRPGGRRFGASFLPEPRQGAFQRIPRALMAAFRFLAWTRLFLDGLSEGRCSFSCCLLPGRRDSRAAFQPVWAPELVSCGIVSSPCPVKKGQLRPGFNPAAAEGIGAAGRGLPGGRSLRVTWRLPHRRTGTWRCRTFGLRSRSCGRRGVFSLLPR